MPQLIDSPAVIPVPGGKVIREHIGRVATRTEAVSVAHMEAPAGWSEPYQTPDFDEITVVLSGTVIIDHSEGSLAVAAGHSAIVSAGERIRYSCGPQGASYVAVCLPAFSPDTVHREES